MAVHRKDGDISLSFPQVCPLSLQHVGMPWPLLPWVPDMTRASQPGTQTDLCWLSGCEGAIPSIHNLISLFS